jgi:hypothetical protein
MTEKSWGHDRIQSPAARRAHVLRDLAIKSVDSVDRGAPTGARVLFLKRDGELERTEPMSALETVAKSLIDVSRGRISPFEAAQIHKDLARQAGQSLNDWYQTSDGQDALRGLRLRRPRQPERR